MQQIMAALGLITQRLEAVDVATPPCCHPFKTHAQEEEEFSDDVDANLLLVSISNGLWVEMLWFTTVILITGSPV